MTEKDLLLMGASALRKAALNEQAKEYILLTKSYSRPLKKPQTDSLAAKH